ncbi:hypothetical protein GCM10023185_42630 [Hymenobacter saemangeumensis]|uniref:T9SS type A sorting domain-containing protein n=1 Tax=Hymenobacter saemangeumensis TaxID=1084522 RepID=A0ABP8IRS9_9BACT
MAELLLINHPDRSIGRVFLSLLLALPLGQALGQSYVRPDASFGTNGSVNTALTGSGGIEAEPPHARPSTFNNQKDFMLANNRLWVCGGGNGSFVVKRYLLDGTPDAAFGANGTVTTTFPLSAEANGMALQPDGKLVVVGKVLSRFQDAGLAVARYDPTGVLDPGFGTGGMLYNPDPSSGPFMDTRKVVVLTNGSLLATFNYPGSYTSRLVAITANGQLDPSFNNNSPYQALSDYIHNIVQLADGRVLLVGDDFSAGGSPNSRAGGVVYRLTAAGARDAGFGINGRAVITGTQVNAGVAAPAFTELFGAAVQPDGRIVVAGTVRYDQTSTPSNAPALLRLNADGTPDAAFNTATTRTLYGKGGLQAVAVQPDGSIVVGGSLARSALGSSLSDVLARYTAAGQVDGTFTPNTQLGYGGSGNGISSLTLAPNGQIYTFGGIGGTSLLLARYTTAMAAGLIPADEAALQLQATPVPAAGPVQLHYTLPRPARVRVVLHDPLGRTVGTPPAGVLQAAGTQTLRLDTQQLAPGLYFCTLEAGTLRQTVRLPVAR